MTKDQYLWLPEPYNRLNRVAPTRLEYALTALAATVFILDLSNHIWGDSGEWEEHFGALFDPLGPSGKNVYF